MKRRKTDKNIIVPLAAGFLALVIIASALIFPNLNKDEPKYEQANGTASTTQSTTASTTESTTVSTTQSTTQTTTTTAPSTTTTTAKVSTGSFYDSVTYRSPTAKPADIFKHGRNLMLLNNDYELPEDFKWDLVYWKNGESVDALSLNSSKYDSVDAVDRATYQPLKDMFKAAEEAGVPLELVSAYRSISLQDRLFTRSVNSYISEGYSKQQAIEKANYARTFSGTSEHNTGLGFDILQKGNYYLSTQFEKTAQFKWLMENAENYGFILRYQKDKIDITGIMYEPWHFRYVGIEHAKKINDLGYCLEEYIEYLEA
mgnify:FL=1